MRNTFSKWQFSLVAMVVILVAGCLKQPPVQSAPAQGPGTVAAAPTTATPTPPAVATKTWGCLYEGAGGVYWLGADAGAQPVQVLALAGEDDSIEDFAMSPDGSRLAIITGGWKCEIIELATGQRTPVWSADKDPGPLAWSPSGDTLAYVQGGVLSLLPSGGSARVLISDKRVSAVGWSPDGKQIAYGRRDEKDQDLGLFVVPASGGKARQLAKGTHEVFGVSDIAWSPDGQRIAFLHAWEGGALCLIKADGTGYRPDIIPAFGDLKWLQDSSAVVFVAFENEMETRGIYRCTPVGKPEPIVRGKATDFDMLPSGRLLTVSNPPGEGKGPVRLRLLPAPRATAQATWKYDMPGTSVTGRFQPSCERLALWVQKALGEESLWIGPTGQAPIKRADKIKRLMGWSLGPAK